MFVRLQTQAVGCIDDADDCACYFKALAGPTEDIHIHPDCQSMLDYEAELTVVIGKDAKNVKEADALNYVMGYTSGNDVSARNYQMPDASGGQFCYAKSFDGFAPIGPYITSAEIIRDPQNLSVSTKVNGQVRQQSNTSDMIFSVAQIIAHLSRGTTLRKVSQKERERRPEKAESCAQPVR